MPGGEGAARLGGVIGAPVTPFTSANTVDLATTERICDFLVGHGVHGLALPLHTGESLNLTPAERRSLVGCAVSAAGGRVPVDAGLLAELIGRCGNFAGVKDASYDMQSFTEACARTSALRPGFAMLTGVEYLLTSMPVGGAGCFSPAAAIAPGLVMSLYEACRDGDTGRARPLQYRASALWHLLRETGYPASVKAAMALFGRPAGGVRLPLLDLDPAAAGRLGQGLAELGVLDSEPHGWP